MNLAGLLSRTALTSPNYTAVSIGQKALLTYAQLRENAARLSNGLQNIMKLNPGDRVALIMKNSPEVIEIIFGAWQATTQVRSSRCTVDSVRLGAWCLV